MEVRDVFKAPLPAARARGRPDLRDLRPACRTRKPPTANRYKTAAKAQFWIAITPRPLRRTAAIDRIRPIAELRFAAMMRECASRMWT